jgi:integrating conjugative element protein (TIGR03756 family)
MSVRFPGQALTLTLALTLGMGTMLATLPARALNTAQIVQSSLSTECLDYEVIGMCAWLYCTPFGCSVRTSIRVKHYIPELVVSSYENTGDNPWSEVALLSPSIGNAAGGGRTTEEESSRHSSTRFKNTDAIGHPGGAVFYRMMSGFGFSCESDVQPYMPYFLSTLDALAWRSGIPEMAYPEALTPGMREMGTTGDLWSPIYPRSGFVTQTHDYKVAASTAQRAADVVTRSGQPHVYQPLVSSGGGNSGRWPPDAVMEGDPETHLWQRLEPNMSMSCSVFPDGGEDYDLQSPGDYAWALWRPYRCCKRRGQTLLTFSGG